MISTSELHYKAILPAMNYCVWKEDQGLFLKSTKNWDGKDKTFKFVIHSQSDSGYVKSPENCRSISGT